MQRLFLIVLTILIASPHFCPGQVGGNLGYAQSGAKARAEQREQAKRMIVDKAQPPTATTTFVEADVLINVKADEFVAVFGISQEGTTVEECSQKMQRVVKEFTDSLKAMAIADNDLFLDFVTQTKIYGFEVAGDIAQEKLVGFELKKNLSVHYKDRLLLDNIVVSAARSKIYDLIKVDYIVRDLKSIQNRLMDEAAAIVQQKSARYEKLLGIKLQPPAQIFAEKYATHYPSGMYDSYTAAESEEIAIQAQRQNRTVQLARKGRTFVFNGLDGDGFDQVIDPLITEPVVQFTLYLKVKYEVEQIKAK
jgi:uncharacterized protein YggE